MSLQEIKYKVIGIISGKLNNPDISAQEVIGGTDETEQVIKNYCNVAEVPQELI